MNVVPIVPIVFDDKGQVKGLESVFSKFYKCSAFPSDCTFASNDSTKFEDHLKKQTKHRGCCYCKDFKADDPTSLIEHYIFQHANLIYQCNLCLYRASREIHLVTHHIKCHTPNYAKTIKYYEESDELNKRLVSIPDAKIIVCSQPVEWALNLDRNFISKNYVKIIDRCDYVCTFCLDFSCETIKELLFHQSSEHPDHPAISLCRKVDEMLRDEDLTSLTAIQSSTGPSKSNIVAKPSAGPSKRDEKLNYPKATSTEEKSSSASPSKRKRVRFSEALNSTSDDVSTHTDIVSNDLDLTDDESSSNSMSISPSKSPSKSPSSNISHDDTSPDFSTDSVRLRKTKEKLPELTIPLSKRCVQTTKYNWCIICKRSYLANKSKQHMSQEHKTEHTWRCKQCPEVFSVQSGFKNHMAALHSGCGKIIQVLIPMIDKDTVPEPVEETVRKPNSKSIFTEARSFVRKSSGSASNSSVITSETSRAKKDANLLDKLKSKQFMGPAKDQRTEKGSQK